uniref:RCC1 domain-containing protein 1 n=1 Tax=Glossina brevipalpis TaxID=37001 RepID=A0A1A9W5P2_9MUSC
MLVSGFNGFGQFRGGRKLQKFEDTIVESADNVSRDILLSCSWSCTAFAYDNNLYLKGFFAEKTNNCRKLTTTENIKSLALNDRFCLVLLNNGKLYKLNLSIDSVLEELKFTLDNQIAPQKRSIFGECKSKSSFSLEIAFVACGNNITVAISNNNVVFNGITQAYEFPQHMHTKELQCGFEHAVLLNTNGDIFTWGNGWRGQLGQAILGRHETPTIVDALAGLKIISIAAGGWHSAAISAFGDLYTWGFNSNGQLGLRVFKNSSSLIKEPSVYPLPQIIDLPECICSQSVDTDDSTVSCAPFKVLAGGRHTLIIKNCGALFACGWNAHSQLGLTSDRDYVDNLQYVLSISKHLMESKVYCGSWCTIIKNNS